MTTNTNVKKNYIHALPVHQRQMLTKKRIKKIEVTPDSYNYFKSQSYDGLGKKLKTHFLNYHLPRP